MFGNLQKSRVIAYSAVFVGLITMGSWISIPCFPVPFTLQTLFILLSGAVMKRYAIIPVSIYIGMGLLGLPVFHNGMAGLGIILGPTGGYLIGFLFAALITGFAYENPSRYFRIGGLAAATAVIYAGGISWLMYSLGCSFLVAFSTGVLPFIIGDAIKASVAYLIAERIP
ncbi:biotin transporter BioY [uncultured Methanoregula sp.]|uniref:biotin transporter BioY n=1 Tax=uncultured Methanoregula sp. TaxID=1005933 RepID=UPI002AAC1109|nr:biotin transporter BioY [uncultured Methanoregula sp.]